MGLAHPHGGSGVPCAWCAAVGGSRHGWMIVSVDDLVAARAGFAGDAFRIVSCSQHKEEEEEVSAIHDSSCLFCVCPRPPGAGEPRSNECDAPQLVAQCASSKPHASRRGRQCQGLHQRRRATVVHGPCHLGPRCDHSARRAARCGGAVGTRPAAPNRAAECTRVRRLQSTSVSSAAE